jgi:hypothetical protein
MKFRRFTLLLFGLALSCATTNTTMIIADSYNQDKNITTLTLMPYGNIDIPGQWTKTKYDEVSRQHFFVDKDATSIAVTKNEQEKYPFYAKDDTDIQFVRKFYTWEKDFYEKQGFEINEKVAGDNFIIWTAIGKNVNTMFLYGAKNKFAYNFAVFTDNWTEEKRTQFLKEIFERN